MAEKRKPKSNSVSEVVRVMTAAPIVAPPTVPLDDCDVPFFANVVDEFARADWTAHQLELAAMLARTMADLEREQRLLRDEGSVSMTDRGTPVCNPRKIVVQMHAASILSFRRSLSLHARAQLGESRDVARDRSARKVMEKDAAQVMEDDLLARPN